MKQLLFILSFVVGSATLIKAQDLSSIQPNDIKKILKKHITYTDPNPTRQEEADEVNFFIVEVLTADIDISSVDSYRAKAFELLYNNTSSMFENSVDIRRMHKRKSMCYLAIALLSDEYRYPSFIDDAEMCVEAYDEVMDNDKEDAIIKLAYILKLVDDKHTQDWMKEDEINSIVKNIRQSTIYDEVFKSDCEILFDSWYTK